MKRLSTIQNQVLASLRAQEGEFVSGGKLAAASGVSRTSIWNAVSALRDEGYGIDAVRNLGYRLYNADVLSREEILQALPVRYKDIQIYCYPTLDSTNNEAKRMLAAPSPPQGTCLLCAQTQTGGRGRYGRTFVSPRGSGLYMSLITHPDLPPEDIALLTAAAAVAAVRALRTLADLPLKIKWVNDIYLADRKVAGILTEAVTDCESGRIAAVVTGIGVNRTEPPGGFPAAFSHTAGAINQPAITRQALAAAITAAFLDILDALPDRQFMDEYCADNWILGKSIRFTQDGETHTATAQAIDARGGLVVAAQNGVRTLTSGEAVVLGER